MKWRAWYTDGRRFSSSSMSWQQLPHEGCLGVVLYLDPPYRRIIDGHDWIYLKNGDIHTVNTHPEWGKWSPYPSHVSCRACVKRGAGVPDEEWSKIQSEMMAAKEAPE